MEIENIISAISIGLSLLAIAGTIFVYCKHDKKLKKQEEKLNAYQLKKFENEEIENKKAQIRGSIIRGEKDRRDLRICNEGKSPAKNICVDFLDNFVGHNKSDVKVTIKNYPSPFELLNVNDHFDIIMYPHAYRFSIDVLKVKLTWEDDFSNQNEYIQHFNLI
ncbi:MAG: hypothetical protein FWC39_08815 [Bacteroidetes bacterium]|nr:hypothetical protein [Bacteroidota bacterium]